MHTWAHTHTHAQRRADGRNAHTHSYAHMGPHTHIHTQLHALRHRYACPLMHSPTHICLMCKLLLCHITGNEPVHMSPVSFKVRQRKRVRVKEGRRELHCSFTAAPLRLCYFVCFINVLRLFSTFFVLCSRFLN